MQNTKKSIRRKMTSKQPSGSRICLSTVSGAFLIAAVGCTTLPEPPAQQPIEYCFTRPDRAEELLYLHPFLAVHKWTRVDQVRTAADPVKDIAGELQSLPENEAYRWQSRTNAIYDIVQAHWEEAALADQLPARFEKVLVRDIEAIAWDPTVPVILGLGRKPDEYSANMFSPPPHPRFFYILHDRIAFRDHSEPDAVSGYDEIVAFLQREWKIHPADLHPMNESFELWKQHAKQRGL
ncbi:MAG: hypothetical protein JXR25_16765 [Pontiellaceae bacterium]|nr:hypothetical protein [Pontiellaceae bacterium]MBN2786475.1 hypothetical protein [Pontiellaceae bacterium]